MVIASIVAWFTPTILFCVSNLIIFAILVSSNNNNNNNNNNKHRDQYPSHGDSVTGFTRVSSFLERAKSIKLSSYTTTTESRHENYPSPSKTATYTSSSRLAQSILTQPSQPVHTPSLLERVKSIKFSSTYNENVFPNESEQIFNSPSQLTRAPSFFDRVKSFRISSALTHIPDHNVIRSKSENTSVIKKLVSSEMKKSRSEMKIAKDEDEDVYLRRPATTRESRTVVDEEVDAKADDFISRFKQQLKLQRLESLVRYNELLKRRS